VLLCASSPYARKGALWNAYRRHFGRDGDEVLVWQADTRSMNPTVPQSYIDRHVAEDAARASAEYGAQFRSDIEGFVAQEVVDVAIVPGRYELPPVKGISYAAFVDPSGGSADSMTVAIAHRDRDGRAILDALRERRPPFSPDEVVVEFSGLLKAYGIRKVKGDRYGGDWPGERFRAHGIEYVPSEKSKSDIYRDLLPLLNSRTIELLDLPRLATQLIGLERRTARSGKDSIDHTPGAHDDVANAVSGALLLAIAVPPALWRHEALLINGAPAPTPARADLTFAVLMAGRQGDAAAIYFAWSKMGVLTMVDWETSPLAPAVFHSVATRLLELARTTGAKTAALFTSDVLAEEATRLGYHAEIIDRIAAEDDALLALAAAVHISAGRVKITADALSKAERHPLGGILDGTAGEGEDLLRTAALVGVAVGLDEGRSLGTRAA
jgi:hypothetical protein